MNAAHLLLALSIALGSIAVLPSSEAEACGNKMHRYKQNPRVLMVQQAEWHLRRNQPKEALRAIAQQFMGELDYQVDRIEQGKTEQPGRRRALHMAAAATARSGGVHGWLHRDATGNPEQIAANLDWAMTVLDSLAERYDEAKAYRAEGLLARGEREAARALLESLAEKDVLPDEIAWATLAKLRRANRDVAGAIEADERAIVARVAHETVSRPELQRVRLRGDSKITAFVDERPTKPRAWDVLD